MNEEKKLIEKDSFDDSLKQLDLIVAKLERNDITLDESLKLYEEGLKLAKHCQLKLNNIEKNLDKMLKDDVLIDLKDGLNE